MTAGRDDRPVVIFTRWAAEPVFHELPPWDAGGHHVVRIDRNDGDVDIAHITKTRCGREHDAWGWTETPSTPWPSNTRDDWRRERGFILRRDHAEKIGRPCERCGDAAP